MGRGRVFASKGRLVSFPALYNRVGIDYDSMYELWKQLPSRGSALYLSHMQGNI